MTQASDIYQKWISKDGIQPEEDIEDVEKILRHFGFRLRAGTKHKFVITHDKFKEMDWPSTGMGLRREYVIPTKKGRKVIKRYIKTILRYIELLNRGKDEN